LDARPPRFLPLPLPRTMSSTADKLVLIRVRISARVSAILESK